jgi:hypothetical protein
MILGLLQIIQTVFNIEYVHVSQIAFFLNLCGGTLGTGATTGLLYQPRMTGDGDCGEIGGMKIGKGKPKYSEKTCPSATLSTTNPT